MVPAGILRSPLVIALVLVILGAAPYLRTLSFDFVWDDVHFVVRNPAVQSWDAVGSWFKDKSAYAAPGIDAPMFRPLRNFSYLIDHTLFGPGPRGFHFTNVLLHGINTGLVFLLLWTLLARLPGPQESDSATPATAPYATPLLACAIAALFWAWHPVQTESVAWVKSRDELLYALFVLLAGLTLTGQGAARSLGPGRWLAFAALFSAALLSKEMAAFLPVLLAIATLTLRGKPAARTLTVAAVLSATLTAAFLLWRHAVLGQTQQGDRLSGSLTLDLMTTVAVVFEYARVILYPVFQSADHQGYPIVTSVLHGRFLLGLAVIAAWLTGIVALLRRRTEHTRAAALAMLALPVSLLPVLNIVPAMQYLAERFLYLPLAAVAALAALAVHSANIHRRTATAATALWTVLMLVVCLLRIPIWANSNALYTANYRDGWQTGVNLQRYAAALSAQGRIEEANAVMRRVLPGPGKPGRYDSDPAMAHQGYAVTLLHLQRTDEATTHIAEALRLRPNSPDILVTYGILRGNAGDHAAALEAFTSASLAAPGDPAIARYVEQAQKNLQRQTQTTIP